MAELLRMPEVAAGESEAVLSTWEVAENGAYAASDVIATIETDKAVVEVEADSDGILLRALVDAGAAVETGSAIAVIGTRDETIDDLDSVLADLGVASAAGEKAAAAPASAKPATEPGTSREREPDADQGTGGQTPAPPTDLRHEGDAARVFASPLARRLAREHGLRFESIKGTGPSGRIVRRDVEHAVAQNSGDAVVTDRPAPPASPVDANMSGQKPGSGEAFTDRPHSRLRRAIAARLSASKQTVPHFYLRGSARVDRMLAMRAEINTGGTKVSVNHLVIKAMAQAHRIVPDMNVIWTEEAVRAFDSVDIAVAVATDNGLVTPVVRDVDRMPVSAVAEIVRDYAVRARAGRLQQHELEGGTISVTNLGMLGTEDFSAIINPPHSGILAVGNARREAVVDDEGRLEVATVLRVTLSVDHRPVDGVVAAQWMKEFLALLETPARILA